jgi:preprotein translocase subunit Sss1
VETSKKICYAVIKKAKNTMSMKKKPSRNNYLQLISFGIGAILLGVLLGLGAAKIKNIYSISTLEKKSASLEDQMKQVTEEHKSQN